MSSAYPSAPIEARCDHAAVITSHSCATPSPCLQSPAPTAWPTSQSACRSLQAPNYVINPATNQAVTDNFAAMFPFGFEDCGSLWDTVPLNGAAPNQASSHRFAERILPTPESSPVSEFCTAPSSNMPGRTPPVQDPWQPLFSAMANAGENVRRFFTVGSVWPDSCTIVLLYSMCASY